MDMTVIDTVRADTLTTGDVIKYDGSLQEIITFDDDGTVVTVFLEDSGETEFHPDLYVDIYGYTTEED